MINNIKRILTGLENALDRLGRKCFHNQKQYPKIFFDIEDCISIIRTWIQENEIFGLLKVFYISLSKLIQEIAKSIQELWGKCKPKAGKKGILKAQRNREINKIFRSIGAMMNNIASHIVASKHKAIAMSVAFEEEVMRSLHRTFTVKIKNKIADFVSQRGKQTYIFPWNDSDTYHALIGNKKKIRTEVLDKFDEYLQHTGHKSTCSGPKKYTFAGNRKNPRTTIMPGGKKETFPIRMIQCKCCKKKFSLVPSFLPREKNFGIEILGNVYRNMFRFNLSIQGALENLKIIGKKSVKSKQTILNWTRWIGKFHPAIILTRAGVTGTGYLQEDEAFEKEPNLRTYAVVMVEPKTQLVWHTDYVDHVDEEELCNSFEYFFKQIDFKIFGVTKDKWKASTNALKAVFHNIWIGYCHRHCLKKFRDALSKYQIQTKCSNKETSMLYKKFKNILTKSMSKINLETKIKHLRDEAFSHPVLKPRVTELKENAVHYTSHKNRNGITQTTSIIDNYLKGVKRKLKQIESFRNKEWASLFFQAHANVRNFVPFLSGAKNAHQSPFELAGGQTFDLPWIQVMNVHNAFLFAEK